MTSNLEKYKKDLDRLIRFGEGLLHFLQKEYDPNIYKNWKEEDMKKFPNFDREYQIWYSEALATIKQILPNHENDFINLYEYSGNRKNLELVNYVIKDYLMGFRYDMLSGAVIPRFQQQLAIVKSAKQRFESSLFDIKKLLQADLFDSELDAAKELNEKGFVNGAGAMAGVVLESHLK